MAGRRRVPARGAAGLGRSFLRHPGCQARRPSAAGDCAGQSGAGEIGSTRPRPDGTCTRRRSAAVRRPLARGSGSRAAERGGAVGRGGESAASRRDVAARGAGGAVSAQITRGQDAMRLAAWLLVLLALATGLLQVLICLVMLFSSGWAIPLVLMLMLLPLLPLILMQEIGALRRVEPVVPAIIALISIAVSCGFYWELFARMAE